MSTVLSASSFLTEIQEAKRAVSNWPQWMKDGTQVMIASTPEMHVDSSKISPRQSEDKVYDQNSSREIRRTKP